MQFFQEFLIRQESADPPCHYPVPGIPSERTAIWTSYSAGACERGKEALNADPVVNLAGKTGKLSIHCGGRTFLKF
jgi:hypothetical protein